ncbi:MAG TPA: DUF2231 domain-containing protein [Gammaproteobacteria bacterium]|nr:DUF2231 domain-containing protein [Gammaproteobacteria bacterium]
MRGLRLGGHPLHPALVHFPVACWSAVPVTDALFVGLHQPVWWQISWWLLVIGCASALAAMAAGMMDLLAIPATHPAGAVAQRHLLLMGSAWCVFLFDLLLRPRQGTVTAAVAWGGLALSVLGWIIVLIGAYAGAQLVYQYGIGRSDRHDAPPA